MARRARRRDRLADYNPQSEVRRWTYTAVECYLRGCVCDGCYYDGFFKQTKKDYGLEYTYKCGMKPMVMELVRVFGPPDLTAPYATGLDDKGDENGII